jgi:hypothetical protein
MLPGGFWIGSYGFNLAFSIMVTTQDTEYCVLFLLSEKIPFFKAFPL